MSTPFFAVGYTFYYWDYYKDLQQIEDKDEHLGNINNLLGCKPMELFVQHKYKDLKEEILDNNIYSLSEADYKISLEEANMKMDTVKHKKMKTMIQNDRLHYEITQGSLMELQHIQSVVLYCNYTDLSTEFSATFRKKHPYEGLKSLIARNSELAHMSRLLRETVEYYGCNGEEMHGSYFCGMS